MKSNEFSYAAVIVTYNRKYLLIKAIESPLAQIVIPQKIVIVDNHSTDGTERVLFDKNLLSNQKICYGACITC